MLVAPVLSVTRTTTGSGRDRPDCESMSWPVRPEHRTLDRDVLVQVKAPFSAVRLPVPDLLDTVTRSVPPTALSKRSEKRVGVPEETIRISTVCEPEGGAGLGLGLGAAVTCTALERVTVAALVVEVEVAGSARVAVVEGVADVEVVGAADDVVAVELELDVDAEVGGWAATGPTGEEAAPSTPAAMTTPAATAATLPASPDTRSGPP